MKRFLLLIATALIAAVWASTAMANGGVQITSASINQTDRTLSVTWNTPVAIYQGGLIVNTSSTTDPTGELPNGASTIDFNVLQPGWTYYANIRLNMTITSPTTVYVQVTENSVYGIGDHTCDQGLNFVNCDSQVVVLTVNPICSRVQTAPGHYSKVLRRNGYYVRRNGHRVWVKATYKQVWVPPVSQMKCS